MKILVTGGAGFIGSALIRYIIHYTEDSVVNVDKLTYAGNLESLTSITGHDRYSFEQVDICDSLEIERVFKKHQPDAIMHLAAESHVDRSIDGPQEFIQTNIVGTYNLLEVSRAYFSCLPNTKKITLDFIIFLQMKFTAILAVLTHYLRRKRPMRQVALIQRQKRLVIISFGLGKGHTGYQF